MIHTFINDESTFVGRQVINDEQQFPLWVLKRGVAADLSAECHASIAKLHIRRINPPLHHVSKRSFMPKRKLLNDEI